MPTVGIWGVVIIVLVLLLLFGPKRLPQIGRSMGRGMREFKDTVTDQTKELKEATVVTPKEFKEGLNPFKSEEKPEEVVVTAAPQAVVTARVAQPAAAPAEQAPAKAEPPPAAPQGP